MIARAMVRDLWGRVDSGRVFAQLTVVSGLAPIAAPLLGAQLRRVMPWQGLFLVLAGQIGGRLTRRLGSGRLLTVGQVVQAVATAVLLAVAVVGGDVLLPLLVPLFVVVACNGLISPHSTASALAPHPDVAGSASAVVGASQLLLAGLISPLGGLGGTGSALPMAVTMTVVAVVSLVLCRWLTRRPAAGVA